MTRARAKGKASVLARQKPRRALGRGLRKLGSLPLSYARPLLGVALIIGVGYVVVPPIRRTLTPLTTWWQKPPPPIAWKVDVRVDGDEALADRRTEELVRTARESLENGDEAALSRTLERLRTVDAFGMVRVVRLGLDRAVVHVTPRRAVMCAEADRLRLVAETGEIYGVAGVEGTSQCVGPLLRGIPDSGRRPVLSADLTLDLQDDEIQAVRDAIALQRTAAAQGLLLATIVFNKYRGFSATLTGSPTELTLGHAPFEDKVGKLRSILTGLERKGDVASRIELDYHGKAFVKLRKL